MAHTYHKSFHFWPTLIIIYLKKILDNMNIFKNWMRNQMRDDRLNDRLVIYRVKDIFIDITNDKNLQSFHNMKNCRGQCYKFSYMMPPLFKNLGSVTASNSRIIQ